MKTFIKLLAAAMLLCAGLAQPSVAAALETDIIFTNSTLFSCDITSTKETKKSVNISPLATASLSPITQQLSNGDEFSIHIAHDEGEFIVYLEVQNDSLRCRIQPNQDFVDLQEDSSIHSLQIEQNGATYIFAFKGDNIDQGGTLRLVLQKVDEKPELGKANSFNVLSYNIWATTIYGSKKVDTRLSLMPEVMSGYDALVLTEVFDLIPSSRLLDELREEYPYESGEIFRAGKLMESGTRILSRWPFVDENNHIYDACDGIQCAATRGVIHARINKQGQIYNLFATHTQSSDDDPNRNARLAQVAEMGEFVSNLKLPDDEPVILAGDFNINKEALPQDRDAAEKLLSATEPTNAGHNLTYDCNTNAWASPPYLEYLDYTFYRSNNDNGEDNDDEPHKKYIEPTSSLQEIFAPRSIIPELWGKWDLSDHYAARGIFTYPVEETPDRPGFPYYDDVVHFKTTNGHYMRAMSGGGSFISAGSDQPGTWESFTLEYIDGNNVAIKDRLGNYLRVDSWLLGTLKANGTEIGSRERFKLKNLGGGKIALEACNGRYLRADFGGGAGLSAGSWSIGDNQTFTLVRP